MAHSQSLLLACIVASLAACGSDFGSGQAPSLDGVDALALPVVDARVPTEVTDGSSSDNPDARHDPCLGELTAGHRAVQCDDMLFDVEVPTTCLQGSCGLIVDVHGGTMSAQMQDANTNMRALGHEHGFIVVQPNAYPQPPFASFTVEDDWRVLAFTERLLTAWPIDDRRVHLTGFSQGGYMSWRFICEHPEVDLFASIAPAAASWGEDCIDNLLIVATGCLLDATSREVDVLYMHGTYDGMVPVSCSVAQRQSLLDAYDMQDPPTTLSSDATHAWERYQNPRGTVFEYIEHQYLAPNLLLMGHCYPGSHDSGDAPGQLFGFACYGTQAFSWGEAAIHFFLDHPKA